MKRFWRIDLHRMLGRIHKRTRQIGPSLLRRWALLAVYALLCSIPTLFALVRQSMDLNAAHSLTYYLSWTILGWIASFLWTIKGETEPRQSRQS